MVHVENFRREAGQDCCEALLSEFDAPACRAARSMVKYELGYGGRVTAASSSRVETTTRVLSKVDRTVFTGPEDEVFPLLVIAEAWTRADLALDLDALVEALCAAVGEEMRAFDVVHMAPLVRARLVAEAVSKGTAETGGGLT